MFIDTTFLKNSEIRLALDKTAEGDTEKGWVPAYYFRIFNNNTEVGRCELRIGHNEKLYYGGNIGYSIDEKYRGNHYAGKACQLLLELARRHHMKHLIITCNPNNYASRKTCEYAGGKLLDIVELPESNDMRERGEVKKCIFRFDLG